MVSSKGFGSRRSVWPVAIHGVGAGMIQYREQCGNLRMRQCGNVGRRAMRCGAPAVTPSVSAQAGNARPRFYHCRITALSNCHIKLKSPANAGLFFVPKTRFELAQPFGHYHLKVARLPVSPPGQRGDANVGIFRKLALQFVSIFHFAYQFFLSVITGFSA